MLKANQAVRLGLRASSRNPELAFARALLDQGGNLVAVLPLVLAGMLVFGMPLRSVVRALVPLQWSVSGAVVAAALIAFVAGMLFWAGALPLLAADAEMDRRPPPGNFALLVSRGAARVLGAGAIAYGLDIAVFLACAAALVNAVPIAVATQETSMILGAALVGTAAIVGSVMVDLLGRLLLIRTAVFGDGVSAGFGKAAALLGQRLGGAITVTFAFYFLELIAATALGMITGAISTSTGFDPDVELLALAPRIAAGLAGAAIFAWLEVGRMGALAALAADAEGLIEESPLVAEAVVEALPVEDQ